ncbi:WXG100-like domain-containing protein [Actinocatenispora rupis]|uniref:Outer membrane channel protein CpnT-like N-terminal domain-containing protein n=1 Tax=Actinocatenispora rupis TaxID=519421 RepID=A0A8J3NGM3_9ACTN|nr:hypothetical protein [Actinocatenispora rupis]GID15014.1 hypothetical protein Aru02nite_59030 [Actinocatenispora rupis]
MGGNVSYPDPDQLDKLAAKWDETGDKLDTLTTEVTKAHGKLLWSGRASTYFDDISTMTSTHVGKVAKQTHDVADAIREYAEEIRKLLKKLWKSAVVDIIMSVLGIAAFFLPLGRLIEFLSKVIAAVLSIGGRIVPNIAAKVAPFASNIVVGGAVGAGMVTIAEGLAAAGTHTPFTVDGTEFAMAVGLGGLFGLGGALLAGGKIAPHPGPKVGPGGVDGRVIHPNPVPDRNPGGGKSPTPDGNHPTGTDVTTGTTSAPPAVRPTGGDNPARPVPVTVPHDTPPVGTDRTAPRAPQPRPDTTNGGNTVTPAGGRPGGTTDPQRVTQPESSVPPPAGGRTTPPAGRPTGGTDPAHPAPDRATPGSRPPVPEGGPGQGRPGGGQPAHDVPNPPARPAPQSGNPPARPVTPPGRQPTPADGPPTSSAHPGPTHAGAGPRQPAGVHDHAAGGDNGTPVPMRPQPGNAPHGTPPHGQRVPPRMADPDGPHPADNLPHNGDPAGGHGSGLPARPSTPQTDRGGQGEDRISVPPKNTGQGGEPAAPKVPGGGGDRISLPPNQTGDGTALPPNGVRPGGGEAAGHPPEHLGSLSPEGSGDGVSLPPKGVRPGGEDVLAPPRTDRGSSHGGDGVSLAPKGVRSDGGSTHPLGRPPKGADSDAVSLPPKGSGDALVPPVRRAGAGEDGGPRVASLDTAPRTPQAGSGPHGAPERSAPSTRDGQNPPEASAAPPPVREGRFGAGHDAPGVRNGAGGTDRAGVPRPPDDAATPVAVRPERGPVGADRTPVGGGVRDMVAPGGRAPRNPDVADPHKGLSDTVASREDLLDSQRHKEPLWQAARDRLTQRYEAIGDAMAKGRGTPGDRFDQAYEAWRSAGGRDLDPNTLAWLKGDFNHRLNRIWQDRYADPAGPRPGSQSKGGNPDRNTVSRLTGGFTDRLARTWPDRFGAPDRPRPPARPIEPVTRGTAMDGPPAGGGDRPPAPRDADDPNAVYRQWDGEIDGQVARLPAAFRYHAGLDEAQARAGTAFDRARATFERENPDSGLSEGDFAGMRSQYVGEVSSGYRGRFGDGERPGGRQEFEGWQQRRENALPARFDREVSIDRYMKGGYADRLERWKQDHGFGRDDVRPWEKRVAQDVRSELRDDLTRGLGPLRHGKGIGDALWRERISAKLSKRFDGNESRLQDRLADDRVTDAVRAVDKGETFDDVVAGFQRDRPDLAEHLDTTVLDHTRVQYQGSQREAWLNSRPANVRAAQERGSGWRGITERLQNFRPGGRGLDESAPSWAEGRSLTVARTKDYLALTGQREQQFGAGKTRATDQDGPLPADALDRVRGQLGRDLTRAYHEVWGDRPGEFGRGPKAEGADDARWQQWRQRTELVDRTLDARFSQERDLTTTLGNAARDFDAVMGPIGRPRFELPASTRESLAEQFRVDYANARHGIMGRPGERLDSWLAHEKLTGDAFRTATAVLRVTQGMKDGRYQLPPGDGPITFPLSDGHVVELGERGFWVRPADVPDAVAAAVRSGRLADPAGTDPALVVGIPGRATPPAVASQGKRFADKLTGSPHDYHVTVLDSRPGTGGPAPRPQGGRTRGGARDGAPGTDTPPAVPENPGGAGPKGTESPEGDGVKPVDGAGTGAESRAPKVTASPAGRRFLDAYDTRQVRRSVAPQRIADGAGTPVGTDAPPAGGTDRPGGEPAGEATPPATDGVKPSAGATPPKTDDVPPARDDAAAAKAPAGEKAPATDGAKASAGDEAAGKAPAGETGGGATAPGREKYSEGKLGKARTPGVPRASKPVPGRQLVRNDLFGHADVVRVTAASRLTGPGRTLAADGPHEPAGPGARPADDSRHLYTELGADGVLRPTILRPGERVVEVKPLSGKDPGGVDSAVFRGGRRVPVGGPRERALTYDPQSRSWDVTPIDRVAEPAGARGSGPVRTLGRDAEPDPAPVQVLRRDPDGSIHLVTYSKPPTTGGRTPEPGADAPTYHGLDAAGVARGWQPGTYRGGTFTTERIGVPPSTGQRLDGVQLGWEREPTALIVRDPRTGRWTPLATTKGAAAPVRDVPAGSRDTRVETRPPDADGSTGGGIYRWNAERSTVEPMPMRDNGLDVAEVGTATGHVSIERYLPRGGRDGGPGSLRMDVDGALVPRDGGGVSARDLTYDAGDGTIRFGGPEPSSRPGSRFGGDDGPGGAGRANPGTSGKGNPSGAAGKGNVAKGRGGKGNAAKGGGGLSVRGLSDGSRTETGSERLVFVRQRPATEVVEATPAAPDRTAGGGEPPGAPRGDRTDGGPADRTGGDGAEGVATRGDGARAARDRTTTTTTGVPAGNARNTVLGGSPGSAVDLPPRPAKSEPKGSPEPNRIAAEKLAAAHADDAAKEAAAKAKAKATLSAETRAGAAAAAGARSTAERNEANWAAQDAQRAADGPRLGIEPDALPDGIGIRFDGNTLVVFRGAAPVSFVPRVRAPGDGVVVQVDGSVTSLADVRRVLTAIPAHRRPSLLVQFLGNRRPVDPARAQAIADAVLKGLDGQTGPAGVLFGRDAVLEPLAHTALHVPVTAGRKVTTTGGADDFVVHPQDRPGRGPADEQPEPEQPAGPVEVPMREPTPEEAERFTAMPSGLSSVVVGDTVVLYRGDAPQQPATDAGTPTIVVDGSVREVGLVAAAVAHLRPGSSSPVVVRFAGYRTPVTPARARDLTDRILGGTTANAVLYLPADALSERPAPDPWLVPVSASGGPAFVLVAAGYRFHPTHLASPRTRAPYGLAHGPVPGTYRSAEGLHWDTRGAGEVWVGGTPPAGVVPAGRTGAVVVAEPGDVLTADQAAEVERVRDLLLHNDSSIETVWLGRASTAAERAELDAVRAALPAGWTVRPVEAGWVLAPAGAPLRDLGPVALQSPVPGARVLFVDPTGTGPATVAASVADTLAALPAELRDRIVVQPTPGVTLPWRTVRAVAGRVGRPVVVPRDQLTDVPPVDATGFVPMAWTARGPVRAVPQAADHHRVYPPGTEPAEELPPGLVPGGRPGWYDVDLPGLDGWQVDTTDPAAVRIHRADTEPVASADPVPPGAVPVEITGPADQAQRAQLYRLVERIRAGRPPAVTLDDDPGGRNALEHAAIRASLPPGYTAHRVPAGHVVAPDTGAPVDLDGARQVPPVAEATLLEMAPDVPVGQVLGALPAAIRNRAVVRRTGEPALPADWAPTYLRQRRWPSASGTTPVTSPRRSAAVRWALSSAALTRARVEQVRQTPPVTRPPDTAPATARAIQLANLGYAGAGADHLAVEYIEGADAHVQALLRETGVPNPPPVRLGGGDGARAQHHAHTAVLEAVRLTLGGDLDRASLVVRRNRSALVGEERVTWVRWLGELGHARPDHAGDLSHLATEVLTC